MLMKYYEEEVEEEIEKYLNTEEAKFQIETQSNIETIVRLLYKKEIITENEFIETNNKIKEIIKTITKEKIKQEIQKMNEEVK